jgi:hypothetical protein
VLLLSTSFALDKQDVINGLFPSRRGSIKKFVLRAGEHLDNDHVLGSNLWWGCRACPEASAAPSEEGADEEGNGYTFFHDVYPPLLDSGTFSMPSGMDGIRTARNLSLDLVRAPCGSAATIL